MKWSPWPIYCGIFIALQLFPSWVPDERRPGALPDAMICLFIGAVLSVCGAATYYYIWQPLNNRCGYYWTCIIFVAALLPLGAAMDYLGSFIEVEAFGDLYRATWDHLFIYAYMGGFLPCIMAEDRPKDKKSDPRATQ